MAEQYDLSVIIPSYNSAPWLPSTIECLEIALEKSTLRAEIVVVNDGSTDDTALLLSHIAQTSSVSLQVVTLTNGGVYLARLEGAHRASSENLLFIDSRVLCDDNAILNVESSLGEGDVIATRIGHVATAEDAPLIGRFWEVPTHVFWGSYLRRPRKLTITESNFDQVPKGTGFLLINRQRFLDAYKTVGEVGSKFISDDTKLLRAIVAERPIILDPDFRAIYRPRTTVKKFLAHAYLRGTLFVDSYYGTSPARSTILWLIGVGFPIAILGSILSLVANAWSIVALVISLAVLLIIGITAAAALNRAPWKAVRSFITFVVPFGVVFWAGVVRGLWLRVRRLT